jgi:SPP1 family phage portal protein
MYAAKKASNDKRLATWFHTCGVAYRMTLPDKEDINNDGSPLVIYVLDPRNTFKIKHSGLGNRDLAGVTYVVTEDGKKVYSIYTPTTYFEVKDTDEGLVVTVNKPHSLGQIPITEYISNEARLGSFEIVLDLLDAINITVSNRIDGIEQFIQSLMVLKGVDIDSAEFKSLKELGGIKVPENGDVKFITQELNQNQTQTVIDDMYEAILTICGMPNRNGGSSTSDTGSAVIMRDGWEAAEARAQETQVVFEDSEKEFLKLALHILRTTTDLDLELKDIEIRFTRTNYENIMQKAQVLTMLLGNSQIHPQLAFTQSGMFIDPELAYSMSKKYAEEQQAKQPTPTVTEVTPDAENN